MIHFDLEEEDVTQDKKETLVCVIHGEYPASLKNFGCPDCAEDDLDEDEVEDWRDRQVRKTGYRER
jgi:hypothetical protein